MARKDPAHLAFGILKLMCQIKYLYTVKFCPRINFDFSSQILTGAMSQSKYLRLNSIAAMGCVYTESIFI